MTSQTPRQGPGVPLTIGLVAAAVTVFAAKGGLPGLGNDATSYVAIADRIAKHGELGYFLEPQLALWPPGWPAVLAFGEWLLGITPQITALAVNCVAVVVIALETWSLGWRILQDRKLVLAATLIAALGPATLSQTYMVQTETTFVALVLGTFIALIRFSDTRRPSWLAGAAVLQWAAFMDRYVGIVAIGAGGMWLLLERGTDRVAERWRNGILFVLGSSVVPGAWLVRNIVVKGDIASAFGPRDTPTATYKSNTVDATTSVGQFIHGVSRYAPFTGILRIASLLLLAACGVLAFVLLGRARRRKAMSSAPAQGISALAGHPVGLLSIYAGAHWAYMIYSASTIAFDPVNTRYLAPMFVPALLACLALVRTGSPASDGDGGGLDRLLSFGVVALVVVQVCVGLARASASYWDDDALGYAAPQWRRALSSPMFERIPPECDHLYSNFPEATYLAGIEAQRSPRIRKFASSDLVPELREARERVDAGEMSCLVWISPEVLETPTYQHPLSDLQHTFDLETVASDRDVTIYEMGRR
ncbi:MAG: glycosyltransferase family 39 protein [Microthrixaceae bacterium]|nr:glycosyltransferase family 39 protein [Microthrixaceae bacterium]